MFLFISFHFHPENDACPTLTSCKTDKILGQSSSEEHFWKELHHPGRKEDGQEDCSFSGVVGGFPGLSRTTFKGPGEDGEEDKENSVEEEVSDGTEGFPAPVGASQGTGGPALAQYNQSEPSLLAIIQQMTQIMANL
ncbi:hypothetical protein O181_075048 [Austropuccinia psidii MF-1]|uniref:Uncharacterized protein n=1 Tax=Austropuccinia psidii MF-1 TaxID=1389203 RepID=A0A9Q3FC91_9BASI|nr:hypothetical protein [Austropuccinia psidii MF-1]